MTNQQSQRHAEIQAALILNHINQRTQAGETRPACVNIPHFADPEDFSDIIGENPGFTFHDWQQIERNVQRILKRHKLKTNFVPMYSHLYFIWLQENGKDNTSATRAEYAAHIIA
jgi:hypothetical protein